jgi:hypothetical protein
VASVLMARLPAVMLAHRQLAERGQTSPPARHCRRSGKFPPRAIVHLGEGRLVLSSPSGAVGDPLLESPIMVHRGCSGSPWAEPMAMTSELSPMGERLRPPTRSIMNLSRLKRIVLPRENPPHVRHSSSAVMAIEDNGTIGTSRGKAGCKSPFLACQLSVFFAPPRHRVVKIARSCSEVVL